MKRPGRKIWIRSICVLFVLFIVYYIFCLPSPLFRAPLSFVLEGRGRELLGAKIASDGQWRFPADSIVPAKFATCIKNFEDRRFDSHWGIDPVAIGRAISQNIKSKKIVSGGSTLTMQVISLSRGRKASGFWDKLVETIKATRLECSYSKKEILALYASYAPFGGNVVGLDAASWRYFGKPKEMLTWGEAATLAVLPNAPALIHPGRNRNALKNKRDRLLNVLRSKHLLTDEEADLALAEPLPDNPLPLPSAAPHLLEKAYRDFARTDTAHQVCKIRSSIDKNLQSQALQIVENFNNLYKQNQVNNLAAIIVDVESGEVLTYIGNAPKAGAQNGEKVDIIQSRRSTGSILKPFLYAFMLQEGIITPESLVPDIPTYINGFRPQNFYLTYDGAVSTSRALSRSLNVPFTLMLQDYGVDKFYDKLKKAGLTTLDRPASEYGLSLILGGAETTLWDMTRAYTYMMRVVNHNQRNSGRYDPNDFMNPTYIFDGNKSKAENLIKDPPLFDAASAWFTLQSMQKLERPSTEGDWESFSSSKNIAWKTGTSFGLRDAWALGLTSRYFVGVWVGNADGTGRQGILGYQTAGPVLFKLFQLLENSAWPAPPYDQLTKIAICRQSGYRAGEYCMADTVYEPRSCLKTELCPYHKIIHLDAEGKHRVNENCYQTYRMKHEPWFILPPMMEYYYASKHPDYKPLPSYRKDCKKYVASESEMEFIYPGPNAKIYVPIDFDGNPGKVVFKVAHRNPSKKVFWQFDQDYIGTTQTTHEMAYYPPPGTHILTVEDEDGNRISRSLTVAAK